MVDAIKGVTSGSNSSLCDSKRCLDCVFTKLFVERECGECQCMVDAFVKGIGEAKGVATCKDGSQDRAARRRGKEGGSLLADWNTYAASKEPEDGSLSSVASAAASDLEAGLSSAGSTLAGAFSSVTKGVRELPSNVSSAATFVPSRHSIVTFSLMIGSGVFFIMMAFTVFLPMIIVAPQKFAICFTLGCIFIMGAFFALKGPKAQALHMISTERLPFTLGFLGSMCATLYASMVLHSYIFSVFFSGIQVLALLYYVISYFPGGSAGLQFLTSFFTSAVMKCFGR